MKVKTAELIMALLMAALSVIFMVKSAELNIGWVSERGPGAGAWPFWLSTGMLLCCVVIIFRWFKGTTRESRSTEPYIPRKGLPIVLITIAALTALLLGTQYIGIYISLVGFLFFYVKILGGHGWPLSLAITFLTPVFVFCLFEWGLTVPLPKGISEPLFYPIYELMYG